MSVVVCTLWDETMSDKTFFLDIIFVNHAAFVPKNANFSLKTKSVNKTYFVWMSDISVKKSKSHSICT